MLIDTEQPREPCSHLANLARELPDWLRARTGWPESVVAGACRLAASVTGAAAGSVEADVELEHGVVHLHVGCCRDAELIAEVPGAEVCLVAHHGEVVLRLV